MDVPFDMASFLHMRDQYVQTVHAMHLSRTQEAAQGMPPSRAELDGQQHAMFRLLTSFERLLATGGAHVPMVVLELCNIMDIAPTAQALPVAAVAVEAPSRKRPRTSSAPACTFSSEKQPPPTCDSSDDEEERDVAESDVDAAASIDALGTLCSCMPGGGGLGNGVYLKCGACGCLVHSWCSPILYHVAAEVVEAHFPLGKAPTTFKCQHCVHLWTVRPKRGNVRWAGLARPMGVVATRPLPYMSEDRPMEQHCVRFVIECLMYDTFRLWEQLGFAVYGMTEAELRKRLPLMAKAGGLRPAHLALFALPQQLGELGEGLFGLRIEQFAGFPLDMELLQQHGLVSRGAQALRALCTQLDAKKVCLDCAAGETASDVRRRFFYLLLTRTHENFLNACRMLVPNRAPAGAHASPRSAPACLRRRSATAGAEPSPGVPDADVASPPCSDDEGEGGSVDGCRVGGDDEGARE